MKLGAKVKDKINDLPENHILFPDISDLCLEKPNKVVIQAEKQFLASSQDRNTLRSVVRVLSNSDQYHEHFVCELKLPILKDPDKSNGGIGDVQAGRGL